MYKATTNKIILCKIIVFCSLLLLPELVGSQENYKFERMWPTLKRPWYFIQPNSIASNLRGNLYVVDTLNNEVQKFTLDGIFITKWGSYGKGNGEFDGPSGIAVDSDDNVYVTDLHKKL
jgi:DNA-binding beta-propeller fold protein YncE